MTREDIIRMAREAGFESHDAIINHPKELQRFANLVEAAALDRIKWDSLHTCHADCDKPICKAVREAVAAEREACAELIPPQYFELRDLIRARREQ